MGDTNRKTSLYSAFRRTCCSKVPMRVFCRKISTAMCYRQHISLSPPPDNFQYEDHAGRKKGRRCCCPVTVDTANASPGGADDGENQKLKKVLTWPELTLLAVGMMVGAGIFAMPGKAIVTTGPGLVLSYGITSVAVTIVALCYAELAAAIPSTGAAYSYTYHYFGEFWAWIVGWSLLLEYVVGCAVESRAWTHYLVAVIHSAGLEVPVVLYDLHIPKLAFISLNITAVVLVVALSMIVIWGVKESSHVNTVLVMTKIGVLVFFVVIGLTKFNANNLTPLMPHGIDGVFKGAAMIYFGFLGFDGACSLSKEVKNPRQSLPAALIGSLLIVSVVFTMVAFTLCGAVPYTQVSATEPLLSVSKDTVVRVAISAGALVASPTVILTETMALSRILHRMSSDNLIPPCLSKLYRHQPVNAILVAMTAISLMALVFDVSTLGSLTSIGASLAFTSVFCALIFRRHVSERSNQVDPSERVWLAGGIFLAMGSSSLWSLSWYGSWARQLQWLLGSWTVVVILVLSTVSFIIQHKRGKFCARSKIFKVPLVPLVPLVGMSITLHIVMGVGLAACSVYAVWILIGLVIYFSYGICLSHNARVNPNGRAAHAAGTGEADTDLLLEKKEND